MKNYEEGKEKMKKFINEFKVFIMRGNVLDMAIGVIVATAFGKITTSLINDLIMPFIAWIFGTRDMTALNIVVREAVVNAEGVETASAITLGFGSFVAAVVDFILIAFVVFLIMKTANKLGEKRRLEAEAKKAAEEAAKAAEPTPPTTEELLTQILEELKKK